jgi:hypothetical protein
MYILPQTMVAYRQKVRFETLRNQCPRGQGHLRPRRNEKRAFHADLSKKIAKGGGLSPIAFCIMYSHTLVNYKIFLDILKLIFSCYFSYSISLCVTRH